MTPEAHARQEIDTRLAESGWIVQNHAEMNLSAGLGIAVREFPLKSGHADYMLYVDAHAAGIIEAKPVGHTLTGVEIQSSKYTDGLPDILPHYYRPLPFAYESTGVKTRFTNGLDPEPASREVFQFHRPEEILRLVKLGGDQLRTNLRNLPGLMTEGLWPVQITTIQNLERSLAAYKPRALIQMATGSGKTFTACSFCYRLIKYGGAKRVLFLVDRNTLGKQAETEFQQYRSPYTGKSFAEEYTVQRLQSNTIGNATKVCITTIQRLYSILKGEEEFGEDREEESMFESRRSLLKEALPVVYNATIPPETFDVIVVDECHRSIYNAWRQVLQYFDAFIIGLTATPTAQTLGFFNKNLVQDYSHERAVTDGINVGYDVYRIRTRITSEGGRLEAESGILVPRRDKRTRMNRYAELDEDIDYEPAELDRGVVNPDQMRTVIRTFRDRLPLDIFPGRTEVPKTLVFAKDDSHAEDLVGIIREEFGKGNDFCQKITYRTTGKTPEAVLSEFRNSYNPRIAVTVDMISTGTDVKPLECLLFMRMIRSASYFEQMKGRGVRIINPDDLKGVTPDANVKDRFVIVDAVGVCEEDKSFSQPLDRQPSVPLKQIVQLVAQGAASEDIVSTLASRLIRLESRLDPDQKEQIAEAGDGVSLPGLAAGLLESIDPDRVESAARELHSLPDDAQPSEEQCAAAMTSRMREALKPLHNPKLREAILAIQAKTEQIIDENTLDELVAAGYDEAAEQKARSTLDDFRRFIEEHRDDIEALSILYNSPHRARLRFAQVKELARALKNPPLNLDPPEKRLWQLYEAAEPDRVRGSGGKALVDLVAIVRHAINPDAPLVPVADVVEERYRAWLAEQEARGVAFTPEQQTWLDLIRDHVATSLTIDADDFSFTPFTERGGIGKAYELFGDRLEDILNDLNERLAA